MKFIALLLTLSFVLSCTKLPEYKTASHFPVVTNPTRINQANVSITQKLEIIDLNESNTIVMDQVFSDQSVAKVMIEIQSLSSRIDKNATIYLVLNTPGGSVDAGLRLISFIKALPQDVKTLSLFSASMGFQTIQGLSERLILDTGTVMSHRAKFGCQGEAEGEIESCMNWIMSMINDLDAKAASRMSMSVPAYKELIRDEYWAYGAQAVKDKAVDRMVLAKCGKGMSRTKIIQVETFFGTFDVEVSKCPLIPGFFSAKPSNKNAKQDNGSTLLYVSRMFGDKKTFVNEYITTNKWTQFQK
jgi:ATP-dependent Clp protease, protease subunit